MFYNRPGGYLVESGIEGANFETAWISAFKRKDLKMHEANVNTGTGKKQRGGELIAPAPEYIGSYEAAPGVVVSIKKGDAFIYADNKAAQLAALLNLTYGGGGEAFRNMSIQLQDNVLWLAADMATELVDLLRVACDDAAKGVNE
jgi:hypothetical protein